MKYFLLVYLILAIYKNNKKKDNRLKKKKEMKMKMKQETKIQLNVKELIAETQLLNY